MRKQYTTEFKLKVAKMAAAHTGDGGGSCSDVAEVTGIHQSIVSRWMRDYKNGKLQDEKEREPESRDNDGYLRSIDKTLKKILKVLNKPEVPKELVDVIAKELNATS